MITQDDSKNMIWVAYCDLKADYQQLKKERDELKTQNEQLTTLFNESPDLTFDEVKRIFIDELVEHDAEVIETIKRKWADHLHQEDDYTKFEILDALQHEIDKLRQKTQEPK